jgi:type I restriction enzyme, S subunit
MKNEWVTHKLAAVTTKIGSGATPLGGEKAYKQQGVSLIRSMNVYDDGFRDMGLARIDDNQATQLSNVVVEQGDVLLNITGASIARCCLVPSQVLPARVNQHVSIIRPVKDKLNSAFLRYLLTSRDYKERLLHTGEKGGATRQAITKAELQELAICYPASLPEQQRIVGILDEAFEGIAKARANAEKNLQNARTLFESQVHSIFTQHGKGWVKKRLGAVAEFKNGLNYTKSSNGRTLPVVGVGDFQSNNVVPIEQLQTATIDGELPSEYAIREGDILTVRSNGSKDLVGRCMIVPEVSRTTSYSGFIIRIRVSPAEVFPAFLLHFMKSHDTRDRLTRDGGGANINNINQTKLAALPVSLPSLTEQKDIVGQVDALTAKTHRLEGIYQQKLAALDELKKSLLHQAFTGNL